jgi:cell division protein FtsB
MSSAGEVDTIGHVSIRFPVTLSVLGTILLAILTYWFWRETQSVKETLIFFGAGVAAVGQVAAAFYTARMLAASIQKNRQSATREQQTDAREARYEEMEKARDILRLKMAAMEYGHRWNDPSMYHVRDTLREVYKRHDAKEDLKKYIEERQTNVIH